MHSFIVGKDSMLNVCVAKVCVPWVTAGTPTFLAVTTRISGMLADFLYELPASGSPTAFL